MGGGRAPEIRGPALMINMIRQRARAVVLGLLILILGLMFLVRLPFLVVSGLEGQPVLYLPVYQQRSFSLNYTHSVHKSQVWENFLPGPGDLMVIISTSFDTLGVGIPFLPAEGKLVNDGGRFILTGINRHFQEINLVVMPDAGQALVCREKRYDFTRYFTPGSSICLRIARCSPGEVLWQLFANRGELLV